MKSAEIGNIMTHVLNGKRMTFHCTHCISGKKEIVSIDEHLVVRNEYSGQEKESDLFLAPGLVDIQINGINGVDFNSPELTTESLLETTNYLLSKGVTTFLPTIITNDTTEIKKLLAVIDQTCIVYPLVNECIGGVHLEGPFISPDDGAKGAHDERFIKAPDWDLFCEFQKAAGGRIKIVTLAPEYPGTAKFIQKCAEQNIIVSIGHSSAKADSISKAVQAGAIMCTHLGNGVPPMLPRHTNIIWELLAKDELYASIITDGIHLPDAFIKTVIKVKQHKTILVSDATKFAGMPPGEYTTHIGGEVILDENGRVSMKNSPVLLAGAAKDLLQCVQVLYNKKIASIKECWSMASINACTLLNKGDEPEKDWVLFQLINGQISIIAVVKNGQLLFLKV